MSKRPSYPFVPKSTAYLEPGHFWSIPLNDGSFACGRVIQLWIKKGKPDTRSCLAGLMDWTDCTLPTAESIAGRRVIQQGHVHVKTIRETGGQVLGYRELALDAIEPNLFRDAWGATCVQRGFDWLRLYDAKTDASLPIF